MADTKYRPAVSLERVTVDGADGKGRDQRTFKAVSLFAMYKWPTRYLNAASVNMALCL
ncbi:hypothetical protein J1784_01075 [Rahnella sp. FRB 231]|jgi:hypothetical protein|uniref:Uncharacterized protein n=1 Tax=Rahnella ecdela TaxID=2816250 RepID=A0ABS6L9M5_9GAMM|nr:hypothetical protein [Rahnella ecdela]